MWVDYGRIIEACLHEILQWFGHVTKILRNKFILMIIGNEVGYFNKGPKGECADLTTLTQGQW